MNAVIKIAWIVLAAALLAGCGVGMKTRAADVTAAAADIAEIDLPAGYSPEFTTKLAGFSIVAYTPGDGHSHLYLVQAPADYKVDPASLEDTLRQAQPGKKDQTTRMTLVEKRPVTIRGQESTLVISAGENSDGQAYRQASVVFQGKNGPAMLVLSEPTTRWDEERVDQLVASIK